MNSFLDSLKTEKKLIGMIHVQALPGTPANSMMPKEIIAEALNEAAAYHNAGIKTLAIENMHDTPYLNRKIGPEITSLMSIIGYEIKSRLHVECGIQILAGANKDAIAAAYSAGLDFIRAEGFVFAHIADEGFMNSDAGELLRYRKHIGATNVSILTDIKKKHSSHQITSDVDIAETAKAAEFFNSDGLIVTGLSTGKEADLEEVKRVKNVTSLPVLIGSGITISNLQKYIEFADGFIVGSFFKENGDWKANLVPDKISALVKEFDRLK